MNPFVLAVLLVRAVATAIVALVAFGMISAVAQFLLYEMGTQTFPLGPEAFYALLYPAAQAVIPTIMLWKSRWIARQICRGIFPNGMCQRCGYNLSATGLHRCPECGHEEAGALQGEAKV